MFGVVAFPASLMLSRWARQGEEKHREERRRAERREEKMSDEEGKVKGKRGKVLNFEEKRGEKK